MNGLQFDYTRQDASGQSCTALAWAKAPKPLTRDERAHLKERARMLLKERGAAKVAAYITHAVLSGPAIDNITKSGLDELVVTDTIPLGEAAKACGKIRQLSVAELLAETIRRIAFGESVSSLYVD